MNLAVWILLLRSILLSIGSLGIALCLALAFFKIFKDQISPQALLFLLVLTLTIPPYFHGVGWICWFGEGGWFNRFYGGTEGGSWIYSFWGLAFVFGFYLFPWMLFALSWSYHRLIRSHQLIASLWFKPFPLKRLIVLPLFWIAVSPALIFGSITVLSEHPLPSLLRVNVFPNLIYTEFGISRDLHQGLFLSLILILAILPCLLWIVKNLGKLREIYGQEEIFHLREKCSQRSQVLLKIGSLLTLFVISMFPFFGILSQVRHLESFYAAFISSYHEIIHSCSLGLIVGCMVSLSAYITVHFTYYRWPRMIKGILLGCVILFTLPSVFVGLVTIFLLNHTWLRPIYGSMIPLALALSIKCALIPMFLFYNAYSEQSEPAYRGLSLQEVNPLRRWYYYFWPTHRLALIGSIILSAALCINNLDLSLLLSPPGEVLLSVKIYSLMHYGASQLSAALLILTQWCILLVAFGCIFPMMSRWIHE